MANYRVVWVNLINGKTYQGHLMSLATTLSWVKNLSKKFHKTTHSILDMCAALHIDIDWHVREKIEYNRHRERLHGKIY